MSPVAVELDPLLDVGAVFLQPESGRRLEAADDRVEMKAGRRCRRLHAGHADHDGASARVQQTHLLPAAEARLVAQPGVHLIQGRRLETLDLAHVAVEGEGQVGAVHLVFAFEGAGLLEMDRLPAGSQGKVDLMLLSVDGDERLPGLNVQAEPCGPGRGGRFAEGQQREHHQPLQEQATPGVDAAGVRAYRRRRIWRRGSA